MYQRALRARDGDRDVDRDHKRHRDHDRERNRETRRAPQPQQHIAAAIGKASRIPQVTPHLGPGDFMVDNIERALREVRAVRSTALPQLIRALRSKAPALEKQAEVANASIQLRHMLGTVNKRVFDLEKAEKHRNPMLLFLRHEIDTLVDRAFDLGAYKGFEHLRPEGYVEPKKPDLPTIRRKFGPPPREPLGTPFSMMKVAGLQWRVPRVSRRNPT